MRPITLALVGLITTAVACGKHSSTNQPDAPGTGIDAPGTGVDAPGTGVDALGSTADCTAYCNTIQAACTGANAQYTSTATCVASCMHFPAGTMGATSGNSLACRAAHAQLAQGDPNTHCVHAGPSGGGVCGTACEGFCAVASAVCAADWPTATCATDCAMVQAMPPYNATITSGDSIECRLYYATLATTDPTTNCPETGQNSGACQ